jgi:drug/metabolite transporter (DMT)-like permease
VTSAVLFGASTPASKLLLEELTPFQLAGLLYLGAALGVAPVTYLQRGREDVVPLGRANRDRLFGAIVLGGIIGPVLLLLGLRLITAGSTSLLLNLEMAATAVLGVWVFREHLGRAGWLGVVGTIAAGVLISFEGGWPGLAAGILIAGACLCWGLDNHLTALIDGLSPSRCTLWKGVIAGATNCLRPWRWVRSPMERASRSTSRPLNRSAPRVRRPCSRVHPLWEPASLSGF